MAFTGSCDLAGRSIGCDVVHTSNANLGNANLGYAYSFIATVGYTFFGRPRESH